MDKVAVPLPLIELEADEVKRLLKQAAKDLPERLRRLEEAKKVTWKDLQLEINV